MRVLVTGCHGTVGARLVPALERAGHTVFGVDLTHLSGECSDNRYMRADIADFRQIERAIEEFEPMLVFNLAAEFGRHNGQQFYEQLWRTNAIGVRNILELQRVCGFQLIHASSSEVYGEGETETGWLREDFTEREPLVHHNDYAITKWVNEQQIRMYQDTDSMILRFFNAYGPGEHYHRYRSVVCLFCYNALMGRPYQVFRGYNRVFMYIDELISTLVTSVTRFKAGEVVNVGGKEYRSVEELNQVISSQLGLDPERPEVEFLERDAHNTVNKRPDILKASAMFGHDPTIELEAGVASTLDWMKCQYGVRTVGSAV